MCGITGFLSQSGCMKLDELRAVATRMRETLVHRGPDRAGLWVDEKVGVALGFRRLSILDLSASGDQPMTSESGRYVIIFNGEVYNYRSLRAQLENEGAVSSFRGTSDTEVMLAAIQHWGLEMAVTRFNGMFAFVLWDREQHCLHLVRDRLGIKPLYYGWMGGSFLFGSELKALKQHPDFHAEVDRQALALYLRYNYVPTPLSIYRDIYKLTPGTILSMSPSTEANHQGWKIEQHNYWSAREAVEKSISDPFCGSEDEALDELTQLMRSSIRERMLADVPLGAFLSGGIDSSNIVALMQKESSIPVRTFTIGFNVPGYNEARFASQIASHLGTEHTELYLNPDEAREIIPDLPVLYDEPFSDASQIPTFLVTKLARASVTVSLSGDGGDELFAGYSRHTWVPRIWRNFGWLPRKARKLLAWPIGKISPRRWRGLEDRIFSSRQSIPQFLYKVQKLAEILAEDDPYAIYTSLRSHWKQPAEIVYGTKPLPSNVVDPKDWPTLPDLTHWLMYMDMVTYLPDDILTKVDRASMGVSLESRVPYLDDHRVVEFAWRLPLSMKVHKGKSKWLLRRMLYRSVPEELVERPKMGFSVPIDHWLRRELRDWAEALLDEGRLRDEGFFDPVFIRGRWDEHMEGKHNWQDQLWDILMFQAWLEQQ
jgi:asparagine synthase (glutamine-hydrolysing)